MVGLQLNLQIQLTEIYFKMDTNIVTGEKLTFAVA